MRSRSSLIDHYDRLIVAEILHMLIKEDECVSGVTKRDGAVRFLRKNTGLLPNCMCLEGLGTSSWYSMEGVCVMTVSSDSCCQAVGTLTSGPPCLTVSNKLSKWQ
jgi:hypothetical protein